MVRVLWSSSEKARAPKRIQEVDPLKGSSKGPIEGSLKGLYSTLEQCRFRNQVFYFQGFGPGLGYTGRNGQLLRAHGT